MASCDNYRIEVDLIVLKMKSPIVANMILIDAVVKTGLLPTDEGSLVNVINQMFPRAVDVNKRALEVGMGLVGIL